MEQQAIINVDRAVFELRRGRAIQIDDEFFIHPEFLTTANWQAISKLEPRLIITAKRAAAVLGKPAAPSATNLAINIANLSVEEINLLVCGHADLQNLTTSAADTQPQKAALCLARIAELLPIAVQISTEISDIIKLSSQEILTYKSNVADSLEMVAETPLKLKDARNTRIKAFRPQNGGSEHLAIIIGDIGDEPLIRLHSSCYTGDLLGSLACDCGDQLKSCIRMMNEAGGGVIIYLIQEGRGIGLINKLRAYDLQTQGLDTVEANEFLGFDDEEREFEPAAKILHKLGIKSAKLVSNNPRKARELEELGIKISKLVPLLVAHEHNQHYIATKGKKSGHIV